MKRKGTQCRTVLIKSNIFTVQCMEIKLVHTDETSWYSKDFGCPSKRSTLLVSHSEYPNHKPFLLEVFLVHIWLVEADTGPHFLHWKLILAALNLLDISQKLRQTKCFLFKIWRLKFTKSQFSTYAWNLKFLDQMY